jgi:Ohr subfamily peroxiredoxin
MPAIYTTTVTVTGFREGHARASDGKLDLALSIPKEMGGAGGEGTNPEQLFAAGYAACFQTGLRSTARKKKLTITESSITANVGLTQREAGGPVVLTVDMDVSLPGLSREEAEDLIETVHTSVCPYSNAIRGNVDVNFRVV